MNRNANPSDTYFELTDIKTDNWRIKKLKTWRQESGLSSIARGRQKEQIVLMWIYRWGWASAGMIDKLAGSPNNGYAKKLERHKLIQGVRTESGGGRKGVPNFIFTLTEFGQQEVERNVEVLLNCELDPYRINQANLRHDELTQQATCKALNETQIITEFSTPKERTSLYKKGIKDFDVIWTKIDGEKLGIEVELTGKWSRKLDQFISSLHTALIEKVVTEVMIVTDSRAIHTRYSSAFKAGSTYFLWSKDSQSRWKTTESKQVSEEFSERVKCVLLEN